jgi:hypothetical protein
MRPLTAAALAAALLASPVLAQTASRDAAPGGARSQVQTVQSRQTPMQIQVQNRLGPGVVVFALFLSASDDPQWGDDRLGDSVLLPGAVMRTVLHGDCRRQDVRILVLHEGARGRGPTGEIVRRSLDVCSGLLLSPDLPWRVDAAT